MDNPFRYGVPVTKQAFCNRKQELADLRSFVESSNNVVLVSERKQGKTSLIKLFLNSLPKKQFIPVYIDLWGMMDEGDFIHKYASAFAEHQSFSSKRIIRFLQKYIGDFMPSVTIDTSGSVEVKLNKTIKTSTQQLEHVLNTPQQLALKVNKQVVVVIDEFQEISQFDQPKIEKVLRSITQFHDKVSYIFASSELTMMNELFNHPKRSLYRSASFYPLPPIAAHHWHGFIKKRFAAGERTVLKAAIKAIYKMTEGNPFYTQFLGYILWEQSSEGSTIDKEDVDNAIETIISRESYRFMALWQNLTHNQKRVMVGLAFNKNAQPFSQDFAQQIKVSSSSSIQLALQNLVAQGLVLHEPGRYCLGDKFFVLWIKRNFKVQKTTAEFA